MWIVLVIIILAIIMVAYVGREAFTNDDDLGK